MITRSKLNQEPNALKVPGMPKWAKVLLLVGLAVAVAVIAFSVGVFIWKFATQ